MNSFTRFYVVVAGLAAALSTLAGYAAQAADPALIKRGEYVAIAGDCSACHTVGDGKPFAGGLPLPTPFGTIVSTNITSSKTFGIGNYSLEQFADALRKGIRADGAYLYPAMPYTSYAQVSDDDLAALYAYFMNAVAPVDAPPPQTSLSFPFNIRLSMAAWNLLFLDSKPFAPDRSKTVDWNRGAYLVRGLAHCSTCHTPRNLLMAEETSHDLGGGEVGGWYAPNIASDVNSGIGAWSEQELEDYLRTGRAADKAQAAGSMAEAVDHSFRHMTETDLRSIAVYVQSVPPQHDNAETRPASQWGSASDELSSIRGVAPPEDPNEMTGPELYDANCATCHGSDGHGSRDGSLPSLFHNTALGRLNTNNAVMVILEGIHRETNTPALLMPAFATALSDRQIVTIGSYLIRHFGNPNAQISIQQVSDLRSGRTSSFLLVAARVGMIAAVILLVGIVAFFLFRMRRRRPSAATGSSAGSLSSD